MTASPLRVVRLEWLGSGLRFRAAGIEPASPPIELDGDGTGGPSPMQALLMAAGACSGADVVSILQKMRLAPAHVAVEVRGRRRDEEPRRYVALHLAYRVSGGGLSQEQVERAVRLSLEKYCSVVHSLAPDLQITHEIVLA